VSTFVNVRFGKHNARRFAQAARGHLGERKWRCPLRLQPPGQEGGWGGARRRAVCVTGIPVCLVFSVQVEIRGPTRGTMMIADQEPSVRSVASGCSEPSDLDPATVSSTGLTGAPAALRVADNPRCELPGCPLDRRAGTGPLRATAVACPLQSPPPSPRRLRKAPDRVVSQIDLRLTAGREIVRPEGNRSPSYLAAKRALDVLGTATLLLLCSPIVLTTYLALWLTTRGRPIFCQERLGLGGRPFTMYKFRTMHPDAIRRQNKVKNEQEGPVFKNRRDPRVTRLGRFLRSTSIDEMPQLVNVLLGQMSLVGPRPPLRTEVAQYEPWQRRRLTVKPGLTCLWQVSGRSEIGFEQWVRMDLWYVSNQGFWTDLGLLARTPWSVLSRRGAY